METITLRVKRDQDPNEDYYEIETASMTKSTSATDEALAAIINTLAECGSRAEVRLEILD